MLTRESYKGCGPFELKGPLLGPNLATTSAPVTLLQMELPFSIENSWSYLHNCLGFAECPDPGQLGATERPAKRSFSGTCGCSFCDIHYDCKSCALATLIFGYPKWGPASAGAMFASADVGRCRSISLAYLARLGTIVNVRSPSLFFGHALTCMQINLSIQLSIFCILQPVASLRPMCSFQLPCMPCMRAAFTISADGPSLIYIISKAI